MNPTSSARMARPARDTHTDPAADERSGGVAPNAGTPPSRDGGGAAPISGRHLKLQILSVDYGARLALSLPIRMARGWLTGVAVAAWCQPEARRGWIEVVGLAERRGERLAMALMGLCAAVDTLLPPAPGARGGTVPGLARQSNGADPSERSALRRIGVKVLAGMAIAGLAMAIPEVDVEGRPAANTSLPGMTIFFVALTLLEAVGLMDLGRWVCDDSGRVQPRRAS